jgi:hypothetical protein
MTFGMLELEEIPALELEPPPEPPPEATFTQTSLPAFFMQRRSALPTLTVLPALEHLAPGLVVA